MIFVCLLMSGVSKSMAGEAQIATPIEEITVTASRIERSDFSFSNPVISITGEDIRSSGVRDTVQFLKQTPALIGSFDTQQSAGSVLSIGTNGASALNLRNLGAQRTLVLVNGRRYVRSPFPGRAITDIAGLPELLIDRVEVMTGGASALYGADGVSGVVNFIMKDRYEGLEVFAQTAASDNNDAKSNAFNVTFGTGLLNDRAHLSLAADYKDDQHLSGEERDFSSLPEYVDFQENPDNPSSDPNLPHLVPLRDIRFYDFSTAGAVDISWDGIPEFNGDGAPWNPGRFIEPYYQQGGDGSPLADFTGDLLPEVERYNLNTIFGYDMSDKVSFFAELGYSNTNSFSRWQPTYDFVLAFPSGSPYAPTAITEAADGNPLLISRDNFDFGRRSPDTKREVIWTVAGFKGELSSNVDFEVSYNYGETEVTDKVVNNRYNDRFAAALDAVIDPGTGEIVCNSELDPNAEPFNLTFQGWDQYTPLAGTWAGSFRPGEGDCVPINIFGYGSPSREALDWININTKAHARWQQHVTQAYLTGDSAAWFDLPAGSVGFVAGMEWRNEQVSSDPAAEDRLGLTFGNKFEGESGEQDVYEFFAEVDVPLLSQTTLIQYLAVDGAVRHSIYSEFSDATTWKVGVVWQPFESLTLRATTAEATRIPSLQELYSPPGQTFENIADPCGINQLANGSEFRADNCALTLSALGVDPDTFIDPNSFSVPGISSGNPDLKQETADTLTWGFIYTPAFAEGLTFSMDWYNIDLNDAINFSSAEDIARLCVDLPEAENKFCDLLVRQSGTGAIVEFTQRPENVSAFKTSGVDFRASYAFALSDLGMSDWWGSLSLELSGNKLRELEGVSIPGADSISEVGRPYKPEWQANFDMLWQRSNTTLRWQIHYFDETSRFDEATTDNNPNIVEKRYLEFKRKLTHDLYGGYQYNDQINLFAGVNNLMNEKPEIGMLAYPVSPIGRYLYAGIRFSLHSP
jgi:outer membrane receptor protein involved in Fe transport